MSKSNDKWVSWFELINKSKKQVLSELKAFLVVKGLSDGVAATEKAYRLGFVRKIDGEERWHLKTYLSMMQADKKLKKLRRDNKPIHPALLKRALEPAESHRHDAQFYEREGAFDHAISKDD